MQRRTRGSAKPEAARQKPRPEGDAALQVMIPESLKWEIRVRAAREGTTVRNIILTSLRQAGFEVSDDTLCDRRKARSSGDK